MDGPPPAEEWVPGQARDDTLWGCERRAQHARPHHRNPFHHRTNPPFPANLSPVFWAGVYCADPPPTRTDVDGERRGGWTGRRGGIVPPVGSQTCPRVPTGEPAEPFVQKTCRPRG